MHEMDVAVREALAERHEDLDQPERDPVAIAADSLDRATLDRVFLADAMRGPPARIEADGAEGAGDPAGRIGRPIALQEGPDAGGPGLGDPIDRDDPSIEGVGGPPLGAAADGGGDGAGPGDRPDESGRCGAREPGPETDPGRGGAETPRLIDGLFERSGAEGCSGDRPKGEPRPIDVLAGARRPRSEADDRARPPGGAAGGGGQDQPSWPPGRRPPRRIAMSVETMKVTEAVESVWTTMLGLEARANPTTATMINRIRPSILIGCVQITGAWQGAVTVECSGGLARRVASILFETDPCDLSNDQVSDALGELTNIIGGNIKALLPGPSELSMPAVTEGTDYLFTVPGSRPASPALLHLRGEAVPDHAARMPGVIDRGPRSASVPRG